MEDNSYIALRCAAKMAEEIAGWRAWADEIQMAAINSGSGIPGYSLQEEVWYQLDNRPDKEE